MGIILTKCVRHGFERGPFRSWTTDPLRTSISDVSFTPTTTQLNRISQRNLCQIAIDDFQFLLLLLLRLILSSPEFPINHLTLSKLFFSFSLSLTHTHTFIKSLSSSTSLTHIFVHSKTFYYFLSLSLPLTHTHILINLFHLPTCLYTHIFVSLFPPFS